MVFQYFYRILLILFLFSSCTSNPSSEALPSSPENQLIHNLLEQYYDTMSARDWPSYRNFFWEKATLTTAWQKPGDSTAAVHITSISEFIAQTPQGPDSQPIFEERMQKADIDVRGNLAIAWVNYSAKFGSSEQLHEWEGVDIFTLMRHNDQWQIVALAYE